MVCADEGHFLIVIKKALDDQHHEGSESESASEIRGITSTYMYEHIRTEFLGLRIPVHLDPPFISWDSPGPNHSSPKR